MGETTCEGLEAFQRDPYPRYASARRAPGLTFVPELDAWLVARYADVRDVLLRPEEFSSAGALRPDVRPCPAALAELAKGYGGRPVVLGADGAAHRRLRAPLTAGLAPSRVAAAVPFITERATALVEEIAPDGEADLMARYARRLPGEVIGHMVGLDPADVPAVVNGGLRGEELLFRPLDPDAQVAAARDAVEGQRVLDDLVRRRCREPRADLCTDMIEEFAGGAAEPTEEQRREVVSNLWNLVLAGHLTTTALIGTAVLHLLRDRTRWELLCERPDLIPAAIEETARYDTALQGFRRVTTRPVTLAGTDLPAGATVFVAFGSTGRDETRYERPDVFDVTREPSRHMAFGQGVHACPGSNLARTQLRVTLETLTRRLPGLRPASDGPVAMAATLIHRSPETLPVTW